MAWLLVEAVVAIDVSIDKMWQSIPLVGGERYSTGGFLQWTLLGMMIGEFWWLADERHGTYVPCKQQY